MMRSLTNETAGFHDILWIIEKNFWTNFRRQIQKLEHGQENSTTTMAIVAIDQSLFFYF